MTSQYKDFISEYRHWGQLEHASTYVLFPQNIGPSLCIDETFLSCGELYTVVTNRAGHGDKGTLVAMIRGTKSEDVMRVLEQIRISKRKTVKEVTLDLSPTMMRIVRIVFPNATMTNDYFRPHYHIILFGFNPHTYRGVTTACFCLPIQRHCFNPHTYMRCDCIQSCIL